MMLEDVLEGSIRDFRFTRSNEASPQTDEM